MDSNLSHKKEAIRNIRKHNLTVIVPHPKKEIPMGTFQAILRQSGLKKKDF